MFGGGIESDRGRVGVRAERAVIFFLGEGVTSFRGGGETPPPSKRNHRSDVGVARSRQSILKVKLSDENRMYRHLNFDLEFKNKTC